MKVYKEYTAAELATQYNNRAMVPEHPQIFARWQSHIQAFRTQAHSRLDLAYGVAERETLDLFLCDQANAPLHLFIHGGYWQAMDKNYFSFLAQALIQKGVNVAIINYGLCPAVSLDHIIEQLRQACIWLWRYAAECGCDRNRLQISGHSAGGHLCAMLMATDWPKRATDLPSDLIKSGIAISGLFDLEPLCYTPINQALSLDVDTARRNSPMFLMPATTGPLLLAIGGLESSEYHRQSQDLAARWHTLTVEICPGLNHFTVVEELVNVNSILFNKILGLLFTDHEEPQHE